MKGSTPEQDLKPGMYYSIDRLLSDYGKEVVDLMFANYELRETPHKLSFGEYQYVPQSNLYTKLRWGW